MSKLRSASTARSNSDQHTVSATLDPDINSSFQSDSDEDFDFPDINDDEDYEDNHEKDVQTAGEQNNNSEEQGDNGQSRYRLSNQKRKRKYTHVTRNQRPPQSVQMRKKWKLDIDSVVNNASRKGCCKKLCCFNQCDISFLRSKMESLRDMSYEQRRLSLMEMKGFNGKFFLMVM